MAHLKQHLRRHPVGQRQPKARTPQIQLLPRHSRTGGPHGIRQPAKSVSGHQTRQRFFYESLPMS